MTFSIDYWAIINAVKTEVEKSKTPSGALKDIILGQLTTVADFPIGFVIPVQDAISVETTRKVRHHINVRVVIVNEDPTPSTALTDCITTACGVYGDLTDDRTLGGNADDVQGISFEPDYSIGDSKTLAWVVITISCHKVRVEG